jgi:anti-anti-sigma factor
MCIGISIERQGPKVSVAKLTGELDEHTRPTVIEKLKGEIEDMCNLVLDLSGLEYLDSKGLGTIIVLDGMCRSTGLKAAVVIDNEDIERIVGIAGLGRAIPVYKSLEEVRI